MKSLMLQEDISVVESRIKSFEANTGCELLVILAKSSDDYPGASWRFGIISSLILTFIFSLFFEFHHAYWWPLFIFLVSVLMVWIGHFPLFKRLALEEKEIETETRQRSIECFHELATSKVSHNVTAMIFISVLEKQIIVLVDKNLKVHLEQNELDELVNTMKNHFKNGQMAQGFIQSIDSLESKILREFKGKVAHNNLSELSDKIHFL